MPLFNKGIKIPSIDKQSKEKRDNTFIDSNQLEKEKSEVTNKIISEKAEAQLAYQRAENNVQGVKEGQITEYKNFVEDLNSNKVNSDGIDDIYTDRYLKKAEELIEKSKINSKAKKEALELVKLIEERVNNKIYYEKIKSDNYLTKNSVSLPNDLPNVDQSPLRMNPDYTTSSINDTIVLDTEKETLLCVIEEIPVEYRDTSYENSDLGAFVLQIKLRSTNMSIDLYLSNTELRDKVYGTGIVSEGSYNLDDSLLLKVFKERNTNNIYITLKNVNPEKKKHSLVINNTFNLLLGGSIKLPEEVGSRFNYSEDIYKVIGNATLSTDEYGMVGPVNTESVNKEFFEAIQTKLATTDAQAFGTSRIVRINTIEKDVENADIKMITAKIQKLEDLDNALLDDFSILGDELEYFDEWDEDSFIGKENYRTYFDKENQLLYIGSNHGLYIYNIITKVGKKHDLIKERVNKIKYDISDNKIKVATEKGFYEGIKGIETNFVKKDLEFYLWHPTSAVTINGTGSDQITRAVESMKVLKTSEGSHVKCENYEVKDFMNTYIDYDSIYRNEKEIIDFSNPIKLDLGYPIKEIKSLRMSTSKNAISNAKDISKIRNYREVYVGTMDNSSDFVIRYADDADWNLVKALDGDATYKAWTCGIWDVENGKSLIAVLTSSNKVFVSMNLVSWKEVKLPEIITDAVWGSIQYCPTIIPNAIKNDSNLSDNHKNNGCFILVAESGAKGNKILVSHNCEDWKIVSTPDAANDISFKHIIAPKIDLYSIEQATPFAENASALANTKNDTNLMIMSDTLTETKVLNFNNGNFVMGTYSPPTELKADTQSKILNIEMKELLQYKNGKVHVATIIIVETKKDNDDDRELFIVTKNHLTNYELILNSLDPITKKIKTAFGESVNLDFLSSNIYHENMTLSQRFMISLGILNQTTREVLIFNISTGDIFNRSQLQENVSDEDLQKFNKAYIDFPESIELNGSTYKYIKLNDESIQDTDTLVDGKIFICNTDTSLDIGYMRMNILENGETPKTLYYTSGKTTETVTGETNQEFISEVDLYHIIAGQKWIDVDPYTAREKVFVLKNEKIYAIINGEKVYHKSTSMLIQMGTGFDLWELWTNDDVKIEASTYSGSDFNNYLKVMEIMATTNREIPFAQIWDYAKNSGSYKIERIRDEVQGKHVQNSLYTKNISFLPYRYNGKRNVAIVLGRATENTGFVPLKNIHERLELGVYYLTDFVTDNQYLNKLPYSILMEHQFERIYTKDAIIKGFTTQGLSEKYEDYNKEAGYMLMTKTLFLYCLKDDGTNTKLQWKKYMRGNRTRLHYLDYFPQYDKFVFGDNYKAFITDNDIANKKTPRGFEGWLENCDNMKIITTQNLDGSYRLLGIDRFQNKIYRLEDYVIYDELQKGAESLDMRMFRDGKSRRDTTGFNLYKMLESAGMPYETPCKCFGYVILDGQKYYVSQVRLTRPLNHYLNNKAYFEDIDERDSYGQIEMLFDSNSKFEFDTFTNIRAGYGLSGKEWTDRRLHPLEDGYITGFTETSNDVDTENTITGRFPGIVYGDDGIPMNIGGSKYELFTGIKNAWLDRYKGNVRPTRMKQTHSGITPFTSGQLLAINSALHVNNKIIVGVPEVGICMWDGVDGPFNLNNEWRWEKNDQSKDLPDPHNSQISYYDEDTNTIYFIGYSSLNSSGEWQLASQGKFGLFVSKDEGQTWKFIEFTTRPNNTKGMYKKDNILYLFGNDPNYSINRYRLNGIALDSKEYPLTKYSKEVYSNKENSDKIEIKNDRLAIEKSEYSERKFQTWEDTLNRFVHNNENTSKEDLQLLLDGDISGCKIEHENVLIRETPWGTTDKNGYSQQIHIVKVDSRLEILSREEGKEEVAEYFRFDVYIREWFNALERYDNKSGIYINDERVYELPYNHNYDKIYTFFNKNNNKYYIFITKKNKTTYCFSSDSGETFVEKQFPEAISNIEINSDGNVLILYSKESGSKKNVYYSFDNGESYSHVYRSDDYNFNGIFVNNENKKIIFNSTKSDKYLEFTNDSNENSIVNEKYLPLNFKISDIYVYSEENTNNIILIDDENYYGNLQKVMISNDNGDSFSIVMNNTTSNTLTSIDSIVKKEEEYYKKTVTWNKDSESVKVVLAPITDEDYDSITLTYIDTLKIPTQIGERLISVSDSNRKITKLFYDKYLEKFILIGTSEGNSSVCIFISDTMDQTGLNMAIKREFSFNSESSGEFGIFTYEGKYRYIYSISPTNVNRTLWKKTNLDFSSQLDSGELPVNISEISVDTYTGEVVGHVGKIVNNSYFPYIIIDGNRKNSKLYDWGSGQLFDIYNNENYGGDINGNRETYGRIFTDSKYPNIRKALTIGGEFECFLRTNEGNRTIAIDLKTGYLPNESISNSDHPYKINEYNLTEDLSGIVFNGVDLTVMYSKAKTYAKEIIPFVGKSLI